VRLDVRQQLASQIRDGGEDAAREEIARDLGRPELDSIQRALTARNDSSCAGGFLDARTPSNAELKLYANSWDKVTSRRTLPAHARPIVSTTAGGTQKVGRTHWRSRWRRQQRKTTRPHRHVDRVRAQRRRQPRARHHRRWSEEENRIRLILKRRRGAAVRCRPVSGAKRCPAQ